MDIKARKLKVIEYLIQLQDEAVFEKIEKFILAEEDIAYPSFTISKEELKARAKRSTEDYLEGRILTQDEVEDQSEKW